MTTVMITIAGKDQSLDGALDRLVGYPWKTPAIYDYPGPGAPGKVTKEEIKRTRQIHSRISYAEEAYFIAASASAPWVDPSADLADADPSRDGLFGGMSDLYLHFAAEAPKGVYVAKVSKVLHLKLPGLFPLLDSHVQDRYRLEAKALRHIHPELGWRRRTWVASLPPLPEAHTSGHNDHLHGVFAEPSGRANAVSDGRRRR